jgi:Tfp pilus assembly protein PilO
MRLNKLKFDTSFLKSPDAQYLFALLPRLRERRVQMYTTITLTLITFSIFAIFAISPTLGTITDLQKQISDSQFVSQQLQQKITTLSVLQDNYARLKDQLPTIYAGIPMTPDIALFLGQLQSVAALSNVNVDRVQTLPIDLATSDPLAKGASYSFAIDVDGTYDNTLLFLKNLTSFSRLISIDALSFGRTGSLVSTNTLSIRGDTYFQSE